MKTYIIIAVIGVLAIGAFVYSTQDKAADTNNVSEENGEQIETKKEVSISEDGTYDGSIFDLSLSGDSYVCTVSSETNGITSEGTVYIDGKNIRADFESIVPVMGSVKTNMIADGEYVYTWSSAMSNGFKSKQTQEESSVSSESQVQSFDINHSQSHKCDKSEVESSKFEIPTEVTFQLIG